MTSHPLTTDHLFAVEVHPAEFVRSTDAEGHPWAVCEHRHYLGTAHAHTGAHGTCSPPMSAAPTSMMQSADCVDSPSPVNRSTRGAVSETAWADLSLYCASRAACQAWPKQCWSRDRLWTGAGWEPIPVCFVPGGRGRVHADRRGDPHRGALRSADRLPGVERLTDRSQTQKWAMHLTAARQYYEREKHFRARPANTSRRSLWVRAAARTWSNGTSSSVPGSGTSDPGPQRSHPSGSSSCPRSMRWA